MKTMKKPSLVLLAALAALSGNSLLAQRSLTATPITETFGSYLGSSATLPANFTIDVVAPGTIYQGTGDGSGATVNSGLWAFTNGGGTGFGILEGDQGTGDLGDTRLFLNFQNNTGSAITRLRVSYKVQIWRDGARQNSIRLKYNTTTSGFSSLPDLANTPAKVNAGGDAAYNGNDPAYYTQVVAEFNLPASLANGNSAYLRWQYSTAAGSGRRDGLGIADIVVEAVPAGTDKAWGGSAPAAWNLTDAVWGGAVWNNAGNYNAVFNSGSGTLTLATGITAVDLKFNSTGYTIAGGGNTLTLKGRIDVASGLTATVSAPVAGTSGLLKTGAGILQLGGANTFTGTLAINDGTVKALADNTVPSTSIVQVGDTGTLDLNGYDLTVNGVQGDALGEVIVPSGSVLTLDTTTGGVASYKGDISGVGNVVKAGSGRQRFRNTAKTYSGTTTVGGGILEVTENGVPTSTSAVTVSGGAELLLTTDVDFAPFAFGGAITLSNGHLAADTDAKVTLPANIVISGATGNAVYARSEEGVLDYEGAISGSGTFSKQGDGFLNLLADSTGFTGTFNINDGTVIVVGGVTFGNGATVNVTETGVLGGDGSINGNVAFEDGSFAFFLDGEQLDVSGNVTLTGDVEINADDFGSGTHTVISAGGTISGTYSLTSTVGTAAVVGSTIRVTIP